MFGYHGVYIYINFFSSFALFIDCFGYYCASRASVLTLLHVELTSEAHIAERSACINKIIVVFVDSSNISRDSRRHCDH